jgi:hypothetical protein
MNPRIPVTIPWHLLPHNASHDAPAVQANPDLKLRSWHVSDPESRADIQQIQRHVRNVLR